MRKPTEGIAVDAAHSMKNSVTEYQGINLATGERLFYQNLGNQTINIGEFLAVVEAVKYIIEHDFQPRTIYTDSQTAIAWFNAKSTASNKQNKEVRKAELFLRVLSADVDSIKVQHWDNRRWGETPADFGRKG